MTGETRRFHSSTPRSRSVSVSLGCFLLKKDNISSGAGYVDDESTDELDPDRACVPDLVVEENCEQSTVRDNERPPEFHDATIHPGLCHHKRCVGPFTTDVSRP